MILNMLSILLKYNVLAIYLCRLFRFNNCFLQSFF